MSKKLESKDFKRVQATVSSETAKALAVIHNRENPHEKAGATIRKVIEAGLKKLEAKK